MFESSSILIPGAGKKCPECKAPSHVLLVRASDGIGPFTNGLLDRDCKSVSKAPRPEITKVRFLPHGTFDPVRRSYWPFWPEGREHLVGTRWRGAIMSIATEMLSRRRDQLSSVERLIAALGWERATHEHILLRRYAVKTGSGDGLAECAAPAADAPSEPTTIRGPRRFLQFLRKARRSSPTELHPA